MPVGPRQPAAAVVDAPPDDLGRPSLARVDVAAKHRRVHVRAERVDVVHHQIAKLGRSSSSFSTPPQQVGNSYQCPTGCRHCRAYCPYSRCLAHLHRPTDQRSAGCPVFLRLLVEQLLRHLLPGEAQYRHRRQRAARWRAQATRSRALIAVPALGGQERLDAVVRQIARRDDAAAASRTAGSSGSGDVH